MFVYRITVRGVYSEGESIDSNAVIASLSNSISRDSSLLTTPHSSFPPSPEKSLITMTIKEEDRVTDSEEHQTDLAVNKDTDQVSIENVADDLVKDIKEEDSTHTTSSNSSSSVNLNDPTSKVHELRNTFTVTQESNTEEQLDHHISPKDDAQNIISHENSNEEGNSLENPHNESKDVITTTQGSDAAREKALDFPSDNQSQPHSQCNSLESLHSTLTTSSSDSPVATPTGSHSPTFQQSVKHRRSFFPPIMDFSEDDKSTDDPLQKDDVPLSSSKELATQLLSALEKELSNPLLKPTTCT